MFEKKKDKLWVNKPKPTSAFVDTTTRKESLFVTAARKKQAEIPSGNGALKYSTTGNAFVDQFSKLGTYKEPRAYVDIAKDCEELWNDNKLLSVCFILFIRMITRVTQLFDGTSTSVSQKGAELRHEGIMRMIWLANKAPKTFMKNIGLFISVGSWKDIITMLQYDLMYHGWKDRILNWNEIGDLLLSGLKNEKTSNLVKKYLPQIKANSACKTVSAQADNIIAKWICFLLFGNKERYKEEDFLRGDGKFYQNYKKYRLLKTSGTAHDWQKLISQRKFNEIDFNKIHGRALNKLVRSKFLSNQGLTEVYQKWISKDETKAKYTGFVHELFFGMSSGMLKHEADTIDKQFIEMVAKAKDVPTNTKLIVVRDTSGSMDSKADGTNVSSDNIARSMALYFSYLLDGPFKETWIEFGNTAMVHKFRGNAPVEQWANAAGKIGGGTNFLSTFHLFAELKRQGLAENEFPTGILCISDGEFNAATLGKTNVETALGILHKAGFSKAYVDNFVIALWNIPNSFYNHRTDKKVKFETFGDTPNVFYLSGYSPSIITFLMTGKVTNADELFREAMNQEILGMVAL